MINVRVGDAIRVNTKKALFVGFEYSSERVEKVKSLPVRFYTPASREWEVPTKNLDLLLDVFRDEEIKITGPINTSQEEKVQKAIASVKKLEVTGNGQFEYKTTPFKHQVEAVEYGKEHSRYLLGDEQGLGKTKQAIDTAIMRRNTTFFKHCLIVCGVNSLKHNWLKEIAIHSNEKGKILGSYINKRGRLEDGSVKDRLADLNSDLDEFFLITNIETLRSKEIQEKLEELTKSGIIGMVVIDEVHKCKNGQSQQGKAIHCLNAYYKLAATGTPLMNEPLDLYNVLKWLGEEHNSFYAFRNRYCVMGGYGGYEVVSYKNLDELQQRLNKVMLRRKKQEVLDLPPKIRQTEFVEMTAKQQILYKDILAEIMDKIDLIALDPNPLAQLIRLRQCTSNPEIISSEFTQVQENAKMQRMVELVEELAANGQKAIIFSNWSQVTKKARKALEQFNPAYIDGEVADRQGEVEKFQDNPDCKVIVGTIGAMGTGLTLTAASTVIFMDKPWNMANTEQAEDRAHRIGTTGTVNIVTLVCKGTIDERIEEIIEEKANMADALVDGKMEKLDRRKLLERLVG